MSKVISFFKSIRLGRILSIFLAGFLVLFTTACNDAAQAKVPKADGGPNPVGQTQPYEGGMNNFSDTAPGQAAKGTAGKTKALIDRAEKDINAKRVDGVDQYVDNYRSGAPIQERTKNVVESAKDAAGNVKEDAKDVGKGLSKAGDRAAESTKGIGDKAQRAAYNATENTKQAGKDAGRSVKDMADNVVTSAKRAVKDAVDD